MPRPPSRNASRPFWLRPRWIAGHLVALALVGLFVNNGFWQLRRQEGRAEANARLEARLELPPEPYAALRPPGAAGEGGGGDPAQIASRRASAEGVWLPEAETLLRSRSYLDRPGRHVLTPLRLDDGRVLLVDRGWVPYELDEPPVAEAAPPAGRVRVEGVLREEQDPPEGGLAFLAPRDPPGELDAFAYVDADRIGAQEGLELEPLYLVLTDQEPAPAGDLPIVPPLPSVTGGSHLSYAVQWFAFALIGVVGYVFLMRSVARDETGAQDGARDETGARDGARDETEGREES